MVNIRFTQKTDYYGKKHPYDSSTIDLLVLKQEILSFKFQVKIAIKFTTIPLSFTSGKSFDEVVKQLNK